MWINWIVSRWARCISFYLSLSIALWHIDECRHSLQSLLFWRIMHTQYSQKYAPLKAIKFETQSRMNKLKSKTKWKILFNSGENFPKCTKPHNSIHMELILCANEESKKRHFTGFPSNLPWILISFKSKWGKKIMNMKQRTTIWWWRQHQHHLFIIFTIALILILPFKLNPAIFVC